MAFPPPCVDVQGNVQVVCVAQPLVPAVDTPGINLRALRAQADDVARLGVRIEVSQSDLIPVTKAVSGLERRCGPWACAIYRAPQCKPDGLSCSYEAILVPLKGPASVQLQAVSFRAASAAASARTKAGVFFFGEIGNRWTYWSLADAEAGRPPGPPPIGREEH